MSHETQVIERAQLPALPFGPDRQFRTAQPTASSLHASRRINPKNHNGLHAQLSTAPAGTFVCSSGCANGHCNDLLYRNHSKLYLPPGGRPDLRCWRESGQMPLLDGRSEDLNQCSWAPFITPSELHFSALLDLPSCPPWPDHHKRMHSLPSGHKSFGPLHCVDSLAYLWALPMGCELMWRFLLTRERVNLPSICDPTSSSA